MAIDEAKARAKAHQVNDVSKDYHLSHAIFACNKIVENEFKNFSKEKIKELKERLLAAEKSKDIDRIKEVSKEIDRLDRPFRIYVEYFAKKSGAVDIPKPRVVVQPAVNQLLIELPEDLLFKALNKDGSYNKEGIKEIRRKTAHEIAHVVLHPKELLEIMGLQGSIVLTDDEKEKEADIFADELLRLRYERNKQLFESGDWEAF